MGFCTGMQLNRLQSSACPILPPPPTYLHRLPITDSPDLGSEVWVPQPPTSTGKVLRATLTGEAGVLSEICEDAQRESRGPMGWNPIKASILFQSTKPPEPPLRGQLRGFRVWHWGQTPHTRLHSRLRFQLPHLKVILSKSFHFFVPVVCQTRETVKFLRASRNPCPLATVPSFTRPCFAPAIPLLRSPSRMTKVGLKVCLLGTGHLAPSPI